MLPLTGQPGGVGQQGEVGGQPGEPLGGGEAEQEGELELRPPPRPALQQRGQQQVVSATARPIVRIEVSEKALFSHLFPIFELKAFRRSPTDI